MPSVLYEVFSKIAIVTISREEELNILNNEMIVKLKNVVYDIAHNPQVEVVVFTGAGKRAFCAGADLGERRGQSDLEVQQTIQTFNELYNAIEAIPQPTIASINGYAFGEGLELALACDLRIAVDQTLMGLPETSLGMIPGAGGTQRLPRLIGEMKALELILTAKRVTSLEAHQYGILSKVVSNEKLEEETMNLAERILSNAPLAVRLAKFAVKSGSNTDLHTGLQIERQGFQKTISTADYREALTAFFEKRPPAFKGI